MTCQINRFCMQQFFAFCILHIDYIWSQLKQTMNRRNIILRRCVLKTWLCVNCKQSSWTFSINRFLTKKQNMQVYFHATIWFLNNSKFFFLTTIALHISLTTTSYVSRFSLSNSLSKDLSKFFDSFEETWSKKVKEIDTKIEINFKTLKSINWFNANTMNDVVNRVLTNRKIIACKKMFERCEIFERKTMIAYRIDDENEKTKNRNEIWKTISRAFWTNRKNEKNELLTIERREVSMKISREKLIEISRWELTVFVEFLSKRWWQNSHDIRSIKFFVNWLHVMSKSSSK